MRRYDPVHQKTGHPQADTLRVQRRRGHRPDDSHERAGPVVQADLKRRGPLSDRYEAYSVSGNDQGGHPQRQGLQDDVQRASYKGEGAPKDKDSDGDPCRRARCHQDFPHQKDRPVHSREHT